MFNEGILRATTESELVFLVSDMAAEQASKGRRALGSERVLGRSFRLKCDGAHATHLSARTMLGDNGYKKETTDARASIFESSAEESIVATVRVRCDDYPRAAQ